VEHAPVSIALLMSLAGATTTVNQSLRAMMRLATTAQRVGHDESAASNTAISLEPLVDSPRREVLERLSISGPGFSELTL